jgi:hypothetical protein
LLWLTAWRPAFALQAFFDHVWTALIDAKLQIRECAAKTLSSCLALVAMRASFNRQQWYTYVRAWG